MLRRSIFADRAIIRRDQNTIKNIRFNVLPQLRAALHQLKADGAAPSVIFASRREIQDEVDAEITNLQNSKIFIKRRIRDFQDRIERLQDLEF